MALAGRRAPGIGQRSSCRTSPGKGVTVDRSPGVWGLERPWRARAKVPRSKLVANFRTPRFDVVKAVATHLGTLLLGSPQQTQVYPSLCLALPPRLLFRRSGNIVGAAYASTESAGRNRPKSPILYGSWPGGGSDADATDHRDQNHFRDLLVPPGLLRHQYCHVRPDRRRSFCLFTQGQVPTRTAVLRPDRGDTGIRPNHQSRDPGAIDAGDRRLAVAHFFGRVGRIRSLSRRSVFLCGRCREPCADAQPLPKGAISITPCL